MQRQKWFRIFIYVMLIAMVGSTLLMVIEPFLALLTAKSRTLIIASGLPGRYLTSRVTVKSA